jgi:dipeptidyl aminopeptidase/acylaminoacyl peptidase
MTVLAMLLLVALWLIVMQNFADAVAAQTHPFCARDLWDMTRVGSPQVAPDGETVVFTCRVTDFEANKGRDDLWLINADGTLPRRLTSHPAGSSSPQWAADGKTIYFLSKRTDSTQVWRIRPDGGEAEQVTNLPLDVGCFRLSPNGQHLAVSLEVFPDADGIEDTKQRLEELQRRPATGRVYDRLFIRHWDTWKDGRRSHLFVLPLAGGTPCDVMKGLDADVPSKPFGDASELTFTPDGKTLVFAARHVGREEAWSTRFDLYSVPIDGSALPTVLVDGQGATVTDPVFAPNGKLLAYRAMARAGYEADRFRVGLLRWPRGKPAILTEKWDRSAGPLTWSPDSETLYTCADNVGQYSLFAVDVATGDVRTVVTEGRVSDVVVAGKRLVYGLRHLRSPVELCSIKPSGDDARPVTNITPAPGRHPHGRARAVLLLPWNDEKVYAHVVKPVDFTLVGGAGRGGGGGGVGRGRGIGGR